MTASVNMPTIPRQDRLDPETAVALYRDADLLTLGQMAQQVRFRLNPDPMVTYAIDRNINYTNICTSRCAFCAFWRAGNHPEAYVMDQDLLARKCDETRALGGTHILYQGGLNPDLDLQWHEEQIRLIRQRGLNVHGYSPPEIVHMARQSGLSVRTVITRLMEAGLGSIPGGGAEILVDRVRLKVSPGKASAGQWLSVMRTAHELGLRTTATMMFGHIESDEERIEHIFAIRGLQDQTGGFTAFIPWPYQPGKRTILGRAAGGTTYLRTLAISRLILDNVPHIQASWVTQGKQIGQVALHFGADDIGSTMIEENVVSSAGVSMPPSGLPAPEMVRLIEAAGFQAEQRNVLYEPVPN
ncbi:MAG: dehypoxanthine futalosine cyclase [Deltaproteobacteria bacterium]|nr:dehypoxanthine futalosine cyclase [Deltaproteobacteria bacterium]MBW2048125.1 dehypoxanthine futalosine cyclase [Deltaproteobacteria bacterium]MBW2110866.1 dehypoxanthine futalosine cyclase [Deltaproteobacteria bacterium]MBW2353902.1 dehypoxanthine futalosine cyclase [Deltaproteobacteria bacterium]